MKINNVDIDFNEVINLANNNDLLFKHRSNGMLLNDYQVNILKTHNFNYLNYNNYGELLFDIENYLNENYDDELDLVSNQIAEIIYYSETKK